MNNEINETAEMQEMTMKFYNRGIEVSNKYWQDKIKDKIKEFEYKLTHDMSATEEIIIVYENILATLKSLLKEN